MSGKRRDAKGRVLRRGESQRKDGKYEYKYTDINGVRRSIYSWRLVATDKIPSGARECEPLRDMIAQIEKDLSDGIHIYGAHKTTLNEAFDRSINNRPDLKESTKQMYSEFYNMYARHTIGNKKAASITYSDIAELYKDLLDDKNLNIGTVNNLNAAINVAFNTLLRDDMIRKNPTELVMSEIRKSYRGLFTKRHALTIEQQNEFLNYIKNSKFSYWYPIFTVMLWTGCRVGELCGLRWSDCDFQNNTISINHILVYDRAKSNKFSFRISTPKSKAGYRTIPMFDEVRDILLEKKQRKDGHSNVEVDGYSGFIFTTKTGQPMSSVNLNSALSNIIDAYNSELEVLCRKDGVCRTKLPKISCHILRHTFCTRYCEVEDDVKVVQEIMGHSTVSITLDVYTDITLQRKQQSIKRFSEKMSAT